jgi:anaerobic magnesium-protoporphyrin IX monomethyl ester cyclase
MKIVLIRPPYVIPMTSIYGHKGVPPLGLVYLASALKSDSHDVECIDSFAESMDNFAPIDDTEFLANGLSINDIIKKIKPDVELIGVSVMFSSEWINTSRLVRALGAAFPSAKLLLGGEHVTADHPYILENYPEVDCCILGEGEEKIKHLARNLAEGKEIHEIDGIAFWDSVEKKVKSSTTVYRIKSINEIAQPDWTSIPIRNFLDRGMGMSMQGKRSIPMLLSRGCPYRCTFCSSEDMWTTKWIARDIDLVITEIKEHIAIYKIEHIDFFDLTAVVNKSWTINFCKRMIQENLGVTWALPSGTRSEALDLEVLTYLHNSGCTKITYAPESGSIYMSKLIKKNVNLEKMLKSMKNAVQLGMIVKANIIFGFPDERYTDVFLNFVYIFRMALAGIHDNPCFGFTPYPGSALFKRLLNEGQIKRDENYYLFLARLVYTSPLDRVSWSQNIPSFLLPYLSLGGMAFFYTCQYTMRPWRFVKLIRHVLSNRPQTMLEIAFSNMIEDFWRGRRLKAPT